MKKKTTKKIIKIKPLSNAKPNVTAMKLSSLPFKSAKSLKDAQDQLRLQVWKRLEEAKIIHELLQLEEYKFWHEEFAKGLVCGYADDFEMSLVRVYSEGQGIRIDINKSLAAITPLGETVLNQLIKAMSESFATTYYRAKGLISNIEPIRQEHAEE